MILVLMGSNIRVIMSHASTKKKKRLKDLQNPRSLEGIDSEERKCEEILLNIIIYF